MWQRLNNLHSLMTHLPTPFITIPFVFRWTSLLMVGRSRLKADVQFLQNASPQPAWSSFVWCGRFTYCRASGNVTMKRRESSWSSRTGWPTIWTSWHLYRASKKKKKKKKYSPNELKCSSCVGKLQTPCRKCSIYINIYVDFWFTPYDNVSLIFYGDRCLFFCFF